MNILVLSKKDINFKNFNLLLSNSKLNFYFFDKKFINDDQKLHKLTDSNFYELAYEEALKFLLSQENFHERYFENTDNSLIFSYLKQNHLEKYNDLFKECSSYLSYWINNYNYYVQFDGAVIFNGTNIKDRTFCKVYSHSRLRIFTTEYLFTGNDYYLYPSSSSISNNFPLFQRFLSLNKLSQVDTRLDSKIKNMFKFNLNIKNTSYKTPEEDLKTKKGKFFIIIAQVANDASLINSNHQFYSSINLYEKLALKAISKDYQIVIKFHPWEREKLSKNFSYEIFKKKEIASSCILLLDDHIDNYINKNSIIFSISSQFLLFYAYTYGVKTICFKNFYSHSDLFFEIKNISEIPFQDFNNQLTLKEYKLLTIYLSYFLFIDEFIINKSSTKFLKVFNKYCESKPQFTSIKHKTFVNKNIFNLRNIFVKKFKNKNSISYKLIKSFYRKFLR